MTEIEKYLLARPGWIPVRALATEFKIGQRKFRSKGDKPGLCSAFAISSTRGLKHVKNATREEYLACRHKLRRSAATVFRRTKLLDQARHQVLAPTTPRTEADTGQGLLDWVDS